MSGRNIQTPPPKPIGTTPITDAKVIAVMDKAKDFPWFHENITFDEIKIHMKLMGLNKLIQETKDEMILLVTYTMKRDLLIELDRVETLAKSQQK